MISITKNGKPLEKTEYTYDNKTKTLSTNIDGVVIDSGDSSTIKAGKNSVVVRRDIFEVIIFDREMEITLCPYEIPGYICDGKYSVTGKPSIIADNILSEIIYTRKGKGCIVYKVKNHGSEKETYLIFRDGIFSHGETVKKAKEGLIYKISDRDTSKYENYTKETIVSIEEAIKMYRAITGACEEGTRYFVENHKNLPKKATIEEVIKITEGQYNHESLVKFFENKKTPYLPMGN